MCVSGKFTLCRCCLNGDVEKNSKHGTGNPSPTVAENVRFVGDGFPVPPTFDKPTDAPLSYEKSATCTPAGAAAAR